MNSDALTRYELEQARAIAAWKRRKPRLARSLISRFAAPLHRAVQTLIPEAASQWLMSLLNKAAEQSVADQWVLKAAGVASYREIREQPLPFCDALADRVVKEGLKLAVGLGAATGSGGLATAAVGIPALLGSALRVIHRVAQSYGYSGEDLRQQEIMLHILALSTATTPEERVRALSNYQRQVQSSLVDDAVHDAAVSMLQRLILGTEAAAAVPGVGIAVNAYIHRSFVQRAGLAAKRVFQECWLRDRRGIGWIEPRS